MHSALIVVAGLLLLTVIEICLVPWRWLAARLLGVPHQGGESE